MASDHEKRKIASGAPHGFEIGPRSQLTDYDFFARLHILYANARTQFLPTTHQEVNDAFRLLYASDRRTETTRQVMARILGHQEAIKDVKNPAAAVESVIKTYAAYSAQAKHDYRMLALARDEVADNTGFLDPTTSLAQVFRNTPVHSGPGQIVRYLDLRAAAEDGSTDRLAFDPFAGSIHKLRSGGKGVIDQYTPSVIPSNRLVSQHIGEVLEGISLLEAEGIITNAFYDQQARYGFWVTHLHEAGRNEFGQPAADSLSA